MKTEIINIESLNIVAETKINPVVGFINAHGYTDCESYVVFRDDNNKGKLFAAAVEREGFKPEFDGYYCTNNTEQYKCPVKVVGKAFEIVKYRDSLGYWDYDFFGGIIPANEKMIVGSIYDGALVVDWGKPYVRFARLTKSGKPARKFYKLAQKIESHSASFHDYNF